MGTLLASNDGFEALRLLARLWEKPVVFEWQLLPLRQTQRRLEATRNQGSTAWRPHIHLLPPNESRSSSCAGAREMFREQISDSGQNFITRNQRAVSRLYFS